MSKELARIRAAHAAIPEGYQIFQLELLKYMLAITEKVYSYELALSSDKTPVLPLDPHGFPHFQHMLGGVAFALERHKATESIRRQKAAQLLDILSLANPNQIQETSEQFKAGSKAEEALIELITSMSEDKRGYVQQMLGKKGEVPISFSAQTPGVLTTVNTENPFNRPKDGLRYSNSNNYVAHPDAKVSIKYLPPIPASQERTTPEVSQFMQCGALMLLLHSPNGVQFLHLFNKFFPLHDFSLKMSAHRGSYSYTYDLLEPSTLDPRESRKRFPLFEIIKKLPPELAERLALIDLTDVTPEELTSFYTAVQMVGALCEEIGKQAEQYVKQTITDIQLAKFLSEVVSTKLQQAFDLLITDRLRIELQLGYATVLQRIKVDQGLVSKTTTVKPAAMSLNAGSPSLQTEQTQPAQVQQPPVAQQPTKKSWWSSLLPG